MHLPPLGNDASGRDLACQFEHFAALVVHLPATSNHDVIRAPFDRDRAGVWSVRLTRDTSSKKFGLSVRIGA